jgi:hypothetical protein
VIAPRILSLTARDKSAKSQFCSQDRVSGYKAGPKASQRGDGQHTTDEAHASAAKWLLEKPLMKPHFFRE